MINSDFILPTNYSSTQPEFQWAVQYVLGSKICEMVTGGKIFFKLLLCRTEESSKIFSQFRNCYVMLFYVWTKTLEVPKGHIPYW